MSTTGSASPSRLERHRSPRSTRDRAVPEPRCPSTGVTLQGYVVQGDAAVECTAFDLSTYSGLSISLSSVSGAITTIGIGVTLADGSEGSVEITVPTAAAATTITWAQLGVTEA